MRFTVPPYPVSDDRYIKRILRHSPSSLVELIAFTGAQLPLPRDPGRQEGLGVYGPWALADAAWISLGLGQEINRAPAQKRDLGLILGYHLALDDPVSQETKEEKLTRFLLRVAGQQFVWQVDEYSELSRSVALLRQTTPPEKLEVVGPAWEQEVLGCPVTDYVGLARFAWGAATGHRIPQLMGRFAPTAFAPADFSEFATLRSTDDVSTVLERHFVTDAQKLRASFPASPDPLLRRYTHNPLRATPLVSGYGDGYLIPVAAAVLAKAGLLGLYYTGGENNSPRGKAFTRDLGRLFEQYVARQLSLLTDATVHPEIPYKISKKETGKSVDWIVVFPNLVLLIEVKSYRPTAALRLGSENFTDILAARPGDAFEQIRKTDRLIADNHPAFAEIPHDLPRRGMVVTMEPFHLINTVELRAKIPDIGIPVTVTSIHELEQAVTITDVSLADLLLTDAQQQSALSLQQLFTGHEFLEHNPVLEQAWEAIPLPGNRRW